MHVMFVCVCVCACVSVSVCVILAAPDQCKLELVGDLSHFTKQAEMVS